MKQKIGIEQGLKLQQGLTPLQVQFVKLLEMSDAELEDEVRKELDLNPALEEAPDKGGDDDSSSGNDEFKESADDLQMADYANEDDIPGYRLNIPSAGRESVYFEPHSSDSTNSLMDWLMNQLYQSDLSEKEIEIAKYIVGDIDDNGYMTRTLRSIEDDMLITGGLDVDSDEVKKVWQKVRSLDPAGVGAMDLRDCLLLQLRREPDSEAVRDAREIVTHYFDLFSNMKFDKLVAASELSEERIREAIKEIKKLNPKPGAAFSLHDGDELHNGHIIPDFTVETDGEDLILTIPNSVPDLEIERTYANANVTVDARTPRGEADARVFIRNKRDEARDFIKALKMRQETLFRVMSAILKIQRDFFLTDDESELKPMILRDISEITGYDTSVVSRATARKYVETNHRIYPLRFFFSKPKEDDPDISSHQIQRKIIELIENEDKRSPLTDEALAEALKKNGFDIARRTVAKYREKNGLPVARLRRTL